MSELKAYAVALKTDKGTQVMTPCQAVYLKSEADKVIAEKDAEIAQLQAMLEERNRQIGELKDRITPKQSDRPLQERLNEVCKKHGVSTLQDLDWAFCESEKRRTKDNIEAAKEIERHKYKRCLAMAKWCDTKADWYYSISGFSESFRDRVDFYIKWRDKWKELAEKFK